MIGFNQAGGYPTSVEGTRWTRSVLFPHWRFHEVHRIRRLVCVAALVSSSAVLTHSPSHQSVRLIRSEIPAVRKVHHHRHGPTKAQLRAFYRAITHAALQRFYAALLYVPSPYSDATWWQIAIVETGGDVHAHGSEYSSAFGVLNGGVIAHADSSASAARILSGTASYDEELRMAKREANEYGIHAWNNRVADAL